MGLSCGKESFDLKKNTQSATQSEGFYRNYDNLSYWDRVKANVKKSQQHQIEEENHSVTSASTIPVNGNGTKNSSFSDSKDDNEDEIKVCDSDLQDDKIEEVKK